MVKLDRFRNGSCASPPGVARGARLAGWPFFGASAQTADQRVLLDTGARVIGKLGFQYVRMVTVHETDFRLYQLATTPEAQPLP